MKITIRPGDSFWLYSQIFRIPLSLIQASNPGILSTQLIVGNQISIPGYRTRTYFIQPNDTFWSIAIRNNLSLDSLLLLNANINPNYLTIGQQISIPERVVSFIVTDVNNYTYEKMTDDLHRLIDIYPFIYQNAIGNSVMGKDLLELEIGTGSRVMHINGSFHANEWITTPVIMRFLNQYALSVTNNIPIRGLSMLPYFHNTKLSLVPMVNPDGVNLVINGVDSAGEYRNSVLSINNGEQDFSNWKANINGVDLNNQFPARWEVEVSRKPTSPSPRDYPGNEALSEPESIAMANLAKQRYFQKMNAFHTQGEVIFWGYDGLEPPISETIVNEYGRVSGYTPVQYIDSYAGYKDWFIQEFQNPGYTVELGTGTNPLPIEQFPEIYEETLGIMLATLYM